MRISPSQVLNPRTIYEQKLKICPVFREKKVLFD